MTREEAIYRLKNMAWLYGSGEREQNIEAIDMAIEALSVDAVSEDTQTEERARFVAKETELAHIEAKLENAEKRLQGVCVANFVAEQLERLKDMTDEERLKLLQTMFPSAEAKPSGDLISRADAIEAVCKLQKYDLDERNRLMIYAPWHKPKRIFVETEAIYKTIYTIPSADAVQGEWIDVENEPYCECSVCGSYIDNLDDDYAFCPRCGADMRGDK